MSDGRTPGLLLYRTRGGGGSAQEVPGGTDQRTMSVNALEEHEGEYRARQIRLGTWIAVGVCLIGAVRVHLDWQGGPLLVAAITAAAAVQGAMALLPWRRLVSRPWLPAVLVGWWVAS